MPRTLVVHYAEIGTKGANRGRFERRLCAHIGLALEDVGVRADVQRVEGRLIAAMPDGIDDAVVLDRVACVAGVREVAIGVVVVLDVDDLFRVTDQRTGVAGQKVFPATDSDDQRTSESGCHDQTRHVSKHDGQSVCPFDLANRCFYGNDARLRIGRVSTKLDCLFKLMSHQMGRHFGIRGRMKYKTEFAQSITQNRVIFNDAVVDKNDLAIAARMRVRIDVARFSVSGPTGMPDSHRTVKRVLLA